MAELVVVGGGFAGFWAAVAARRVGGEALDITLVAPEPRLVMRPRLYEARPETLAVDLPPLLESVGVTYRRDVGVALEVGAAGGALVLGSGDVLSYDRLVLATGSVMRRPAVPGADAALSIDTQAEAVAFDRRLRAIAERSQRASGPTGPACPGGAAADPVVAVVGAGFTGIELALELRDRLAGHGAGEAAERLRIVLIDRAEQLGPELGDGPRPVIEAAMAAAGVELWLGRRITALGETEVHFAGGETLVADAVVLSTGLHAAPFAAAVPGERDASGRVVVDEFLRAPGAPHVFVTGDAASADTGDGHRALQSCQHALQLGRVAGENAARDLLGLPLVAYRQLRYVTCLDLGRSGAVLTSGWERAVLQVGAEAKARKVTINTEVIYPPPGATAEVLLRQSELDPAARS